VEPFDRDVGARLLERRIALGLTQQRLAKLIGVSYQQAHKYEKGTSRIRHLGCERRIDGMTRRSDLLLSSACVLALFVLPNTAVAQTGALTQLPGTDACVSLGGSDGECAEGVGLDNPASVAVSWDDRNVYVASHDSDAVAVFARDLATGALTQLPGTDACVSLGGGDGECAEGVGLDNPGSVAVSRDDRNVYVASHDSDAVAVFARDLATGALTQLPATDACVSEDGSGGDCADGVALFIPFGVAVSDDGRNVYVVSAGTSAVAVFARDLATGALSQLPGTDACVSKDGTGGDCADGIGLDEVVSVTVSPDGRNVYVTSFAGSDAVAVFARDLATGALTQLPGTDACVSRDGTGGDCAAGVGLDNPANVAVSPDGRNVYVASHDSNAVAVFVRDRRTGALTQLPGTDACASDLGDECAQGVALNSPTSVAVSRDDRNVYVASFDSSAVAVFARDSRTGALAQLSGTDACVSEDGSGRDCADGAALFDAFGVMVSRDGRNAYVVSRDGNAVAVFARDRIPSTALPAGL
jgi:DNA-binding beta-propeller fold protein YncE